MFNVEIPEFFADNAISEFFVEDINKLFEVKNNDYFDMEVLEDFIKTSDKLENSLLEFVNFERQKVELLKRQKEEFQKNTNRLRELNEQLVIVKLEQTTFSSIKDDTEEIDKEAVALLAADQ